MRQLYLSELYLDITLFGDHRSVVDRFGQIGEQRAHLFFGLDIEIVGRKLEPRLFAERVVRLDADQHLLRFGGHEMAAGATLRMTEAGAATAFSRADGRPSIVDLKLELDGETFGGA